MSKQKLTKKEREVLAVMKDPVQWVTQHIGKPRWYQELVLRHPHHRTVLRMGRRLGKCIAASERILDPTTGKYHSIQSLYDAGVQQPALYTLDDEQMVEANAFHIEDNGEKEVFIVKTKDGSKVKLTGNHPVLTKRGWQDVDNLLPDDELALPTHLPYNGTIKVQEEEIRDWVRHTRMLPEDIYEWQEANLKFFLMTYLNTYGLYREPHENLGAPEGEELLFDTEELAREMKHLFLRTGQLSRITGQEDSAGIYHTGQYVLQLEGTSINDYRFVPLVSVTSAGIEQTYDVHVGKTHNLVVEDVFVHNTWTMASHMLWVAMTNWGGRLAKRERRGLDILVVTPYDVQAKEIYDTLNEMIDDNTALSSSLEYRKQGPPREIKFLNGSTIKLFTAGTSSSSNAASIRGQRADAC